MFWELWMCQGSAKWLIRQQSGLLVPNQTLKCTSFPNVWHSLWPQLITWTPAFLWNFYIMLIIRIRENKFQERSLLCRKIMYNYVKYTTEMHYVLSILWAQELWNKEKLTTIITYFIINHTPFCDSKLNSNCEVLFVYLLDWLGGLFGGELVC